MKQYEVTSFAISNVNYFGIGYSHNFQNTSFFALFSSSSIRPSPFFHQLPLLPSSSSPSVSVHHLFEFHFSPLLLISLDNSFSTFCLSSSTLKLSLYLLHVIFVFFHSSLFIFLYTSVSFTSLSSFLSLHRSHIH